MAQVVPITSYMNTSLVGIGKKLATEMENGSRQFTHGFQNGDGSIVFQRVGDRVRALVSSKRPYAIVGTEFPDAAQGGRSYPGFGFDYYHEQPVPQPYPLAGNAYKASYIAGVLALELEGQKVSLAARRKLRLADSENSLAALKRGELPEGWDYWIKRNAPVSKNVRRQVKMTTKYEETVVVDSLDYRSGTLTVHRTTTFNYIGLDGQNKREILTGTCQFVAYSAANNFTANETLRLDNWYAPRGTTLLESLTDLVHARIVTEEVTFVRTYYYYLGKIPEGVHIADGSFNYDEHIAATNDLISSYFKYGLGQQDLLPHQYLEDQSDNGMGLVWTGEYYGNRDQRGTFTHSDVTGPNATVTLTLTPKNKYVNTIAGKPPAIVQEFRKTYPPIHIKDGGDPAWCDSAMFDRGTLSVTPFSFVIDGESIGMYPFSGTNPFAGQDFMDDRTEILATALSTETYDFLDNPTNTTSFIFLARYPVPSVPGVSEVLSKKPTELEIYGSASFKYDDLSGEIRFVGWTPLTDLEGNEVPSRRIKITEVPTYNALVRYDVKYPDALREAVQALADDPTYKLILEALSPQ